MVYRQSLQFISVIILTGFYSINGFSAEPTKISEKDKLAMEYLSAMGFENEARESYESLQMRVTKSNPQSAEKMKTPELTEKYTRQLNQALIKTLSEVFTEAELKKTVALLNTSYGKTLANGHRQFMKKYIENMNATMAEIYKKGLAGTHD